MEVAAKAGLTVYIYIYIYIYIYKHPGHLKINKKGAIIEVRAIRKHTQTDSCTQVTLYSKQLRQMKQQIKGFNPVK